MDINADNNVDLFTERATQSLSGATVPHDATLPVQAVDSVKDATTAVADLVAASQHYMADKAELAEKRNFIPRAGLDQLHQASREEALARQRDASRRFDRAIGALQDTLVSEAFGSLPNSEATRIKNARDHLLLAVGDAQGAEFAQRLMGLVRDSGDADLRAVINSEWGKTFAISRGAAAQRLQKSVRTIVAEKARESGAPGWSQLDALTQAQAFAAAAFRSGFDG